MDEDLIGRAYQLFNEALVHPTLERRNYIQAHAADAEIAAEATRMLGDYDEVADSPPIEWPFDRNWNREGKTVGDWIVGRLLGIGGQGEVYHATRPRPGGDEEGAIKFLDRAGRSTIRRFENERQILADLRHEGIARFLDGGSDSGTLYVVMEYIPGVAITTYCCRQDLSFEERLHVFLRLCRIVEYAHDHRLLHRDLKPRNVFVTANGAVTVLDFGIAKLVAEPVGESMTAKEKPLTKEYASPEQVMGEEPSFATDVYALGVLLYEMLTGTRPISDAALSGSDWREVICEQIPLRPSAAVMLEDAKSPPSANPAKLRRWKAKLTGDLDAIVMKALEKDSSRRYSRVDRLRTDVERHLHGLGVTARPTAFWERAIRWSARNPFSAVALAVSGLAVFSALHVSAMQLLDLETQKQNESSAIQRLRYLAEAGLPTLEDATGKTPNLLKTRHDLVEIHLDFLNRLSSLSFPGWPEADRAIVSSSLQCARQLRALGGDANAFEILTLALTRVEERYRFSQESGLRTREWSALMQQVLRLRIEIEGALQLDTGGDARLLASVERGGDR